MKYYKPHYSLNCNIIKIVFTRTESTDLFRCDAPTSKHCSPPCFLLISKKPTHFRISIFLQFHIQMTQYFQLQWYVNVVHATLILQSLKLC